MGDDRRSSIALWSSVVIAAFVCAWLLVRAMKGTAPPRAGVDAGDPTWTAGGDVPPRALGDRDSTAASRCTDVGAGLVLTEGGDQSLGDGLLDPRGLVAAGLTRSTDGGRVAAVAMLSVPAKQTKAAIVDLGATGGDDPPPKPFVVQGMLHAARIETTREKRRLVITAIGPLGDDGTVGAMPKERASIEQTRDESLGFDVAGHESVAVFAWDDDERGRGVVRASRFSGIDLGAPVVVSPPTSDAESPRVVADAKNGVFVAWIARQPEKEPDAAAYVIERGADSPESRWLELAYVDEVGKVGEPVRLGPSRVSGFDLAAHEGGVTVVMRDEEGILEARGARLVAQTVRRSGAALAADPPFVALREGVGASEPTVWDDGAGGLVSYGDLVERGRLLPLAAPGPAVDAGAASIEPLLESGRLLAGHAASSVPFAGRLGKPAGRRALVALAVLPRAARIEARILLCER